MARGKKMILMYHKVDKEAKTRFWVSVQDFERQMQELSCKKVVSLNEYDVNDPEQVVITFDGVYEKGCRTHHKRCATASLQ